jgi:hypothetical protein
MDTNKLIEALAKARAEMPALTFDKKNPHYNSSYATLAAHLDCAVPALSKHGLAVTQTTRVTEAGHVILVTTLRHVSGGEISGEYPVVGDKPGPQPMGSALTYARRYTLAALLGLAGEEDDDGEAATGKPEVKPAPVKSKAKEEPKAPPKDEPMSALVALGHEMVLAGVAAAGSQVERRAERLKWCGEVLGRTVAKSEDLTDGDIHRCIQAAKKQAEARGQS